MSATELIPPDLDFEHSDLRSVDCFTCHYVYDMNIWLCERCCGGFHMMGIIATPSLEEDIRATRALNPSM